jgi:prepilin peptidase CpaA
VQDLQTPTALSWISVTQAVADVTLIAFVCIAAWKDWSTARIPNGVTVTGLVAGLLLRVPAGTLIQGLEGCGVAFALAVTLYALRAVGGGDVKLLAGVGAFLGIHEVGGGLATIAIVGAGFALAYVIRRGLLPLLILNTVDLVKSWRTLATGQRRTLASPGALTIPYGVPIAVGTLVWWFGQGVAL